MWRVALTETSRKYKDMVPEPLNCQFPDRVHKKLLSSDMRKMQRDNTLSTSTLFMLQVTNNM